MIKPDKCRMHVQCCENCEDWEPIPFHVEGGLCLRRGRLMRRKAAANLIRGTASGARPRARQSIELG